LSESQDFLSDTKKRASLYIKRKVFEPPIDYKLLRLRLLLWNF